MKQSVIALIISEEGEQILTIKRRDVLMWVLPGGGVECGESPEEAVLREVLEETGLSVDIIRKGAEYHPVSLLANLTHVYLCKPIRGEMTKGAETGDIGYFSLNSLPKPFFYIHQQWIKEILKSPSATIKRNLKEVTYLSLLTYFFKHPINVIRFAFSRIGLPINMK